MGSCVEKLCTEMNINRQTQDEYTYQSYTRAMEAVESEILKWEIVEVTIQRQRGANKYNMVIDEDEEVRNFKGDRLGAFRPAFANNGTITTANSAKNGDGACSLVLMSEIAAKRKGLKPLARIVGFDDAGVAPVYFGIAPTLAISRLLEKTGNRAQEIDWFEINETFAAIPLANMKMLDLDLDSVNVNGGAISLGHPLGMSGARTVLSLLNTMRVKGGRLGVASIANGGGGASAIIIENL